MTTKSIIRTLALASAAMLALASCGSKFRPLTSSHVKMTPQPLELRGGQVPAKVHISFPAKSFPKGATLKVTPVLRYAGGEKWGKTYAYQGEKVFGNDIVVPYKAGANVVLAFSVPYTPAMDKSELFLTFKGQIGSKTVQLPELKIGTGVISTEAMATLAGVMPALAPDGFQRIIKETYDANIMFQIQQANVRSSEMRKEDVEEWRYIVQNAKETPNQNVSVEVQAYASPDGGASLNERLSEARERNTTASLKQEFKKQQISGVAIDAHYTAQDWEGFKTLVEQSDLQDKELVLRVLSMYPDPEQREREIKNISAVFSQLAEDVLPKLRRSRLLANVEIVGKTDEEIQQWVDKAPGHLTLEELLYAATLAKQDSEKIKIYQIVNKIFPKDYKAYNNIGAVLFAQGKMDQAEIWFAQAARRADNAVTKMNQGLISLAKGESDKATTLIASATEVPELGQALGYLYLKQGEYAKAETAYGETMSNNAAVAQLLNGNYSKALKTLASVARPDAMTHYIKAIVAARSGNVSMIQEALKQAAELDPKVLIGLADNLEFAQYLDRPELAQILSMLPKRR